MEQNSRTRRLIKSNGLRLCHYVDCGCEPALIAGWGAERPCTLDVRLAAMREALTERQMSVLAMRWGLEDGQQLTLAEVGQEIGVTHERVRQIEARALRILRSSNVEPKPEPEAEPKPEPLVPVDVADRAARILLSAKAWPDHPLRNVLVFVHREVDGVLYMDRFVNPIWGQPDQAQPELGATVDVDGALYVRVK